MRMNPYEAPKELNAAWRPAPAQLPWALVGLVGGLIAGPLLTVLLVFGMHEDHDPPLTQELLRGSPLVVVFTVFGGGLGALFGALARNLLFWRRL